MPKIKENKRKLKIMKKYVVVLLSVTVPVLLCVFGCIGNEKMSKSAKVETTADTEYEYSLKDYNGRIALYENGNATPTEVYDIFTESLPSEDAKALKSVGIKAKNKKELELILENYLS